MNELANELYAAGVRVQIGSPHPPPTETIHQSLDEDRRIVWVCKVWGQVLGYRPHSVIGRHVFDFVAPDTQSFLKEVGWRTLVRDGKIGPVTATFVTSTNEHLPAMVRSEILRHSDGSFNRTFAKIKIRLALMRPPLLSGGVFTILFHYYLN